MGSGVMTTSQQSNAFDKRIKKIFKDEYARYSPEWSMVANVMDHKENFLKESDLSAFGTFDAVVEGSGPSLDNFTQGNDKTQYFTEYRHNAQVTRVMKDDDLFNIVSEMPKKQALSANYTLEYEFWSQFNNGFAASSDPELGLDGKTLFATDHAYIDNGSGTQSNAASAALSYSALQTALTAFNKIKDEKGNPIPLMPDLLLVPPDLEWKAEELLGSEAKEDPTTANRAMNTIVSARPSLRYMVCHFLTSTTAWFLVDSKNVDTRVIWRAKPEYGMVADPFTDNTIYRAYLRAAFTHFQWRGAYGSTGA